MQLETTEESDVVVVSEWNRFDAVAELEVAVLARTGQCWQVSYVVREVSEMTGKRQRGRLFHQIVRHG